jgi:hypothetical protein
MNEKAEVVAIELSNKVVRLILTPFDTDVDIEDMLKVQPHNMYGEMVTISRLLNRVGNLKAEMNEILRESNLDFDIFHAQMLEEQRKKLTFTGADNKVKSPTVGEVDSAVIRLPQYKVKKQNIFKIQKNMEYIDSLYEAVKNKSFIVMKLSDKWKPDDFEKEIVEGSVNSCTIKFSKKSIN